MRPPALQGGCQDFLLKAAGEFLAMVGASSAASYGAAVVRAFGGLPGVSAVRLYERAAPTATYLTLASAQPSPEAGAAPGDWPLSEIEKWPAPRGPWRWWVSVLAPGAGGAVPWADMAPWMGRSWKSALVILWRHADSRPLAVLVAGSTEGELAPAALPTAQALAALAAQGWQSWCQVRALQQLQEALNERLAQVTAACGLANAELSRAARLSDQFLANMSHELRTPLNTVLGMAQALQEGVMGPVNEDQLSYLQMIEKAGRQLLAMMTDILTLSKAGAGRLEVHPEVVALQALCQDCMHFVIQPVRQKHMSFEVVCDPRVPMLEADENILKQVLVNLLTNAVKFTPERGKIVLETIAEPERHAVALVVRDSGIGIAPENMERLFQPFVQLHDGLARQFSGTGLGLSLVYRLTDLHGGSVSVTSTPGQGSTFTVRLPWAPPPATAGGHPFENARLDGVSVLLVDDHERSLAVAQKILADAGATVWVARQGAEALERAAEEKPDALVVDLQLAGMNGWALMKHIQANPRLRGLGMVAVSSLVLPADRARCLEAGAAAFLERPLCPAALVQAVVSALPADRRPAAGGVMVGES
ncbi:ATP-binding protein [Fontisphaera persica]|uniref:ATP-binding response regulator n=1 Tax=Fontisphaera persica TaxID=2974023 RepID=UPI0024C02F92|nr:ATP-binding protein [Fontisphaera persica]WCJ59101.1 ATP-binding protein [Fontisphaera persica]